MLWTIAMILTVLWLLGLVSRYPMGGFIHILPVEGAKTFHPSGLRSGAGETPAVRAGRQDAAHPLEPNGPVIFRRRSRWENTGWHMRPHPGCSANYKRNGPVV